MLPTRVLLFNGFGWNITIHGNKASHINRKASRSVIELSKNLYLTYIFWVRNL